VRHLKQQKSFYCYIGALDIIGVIRSIAQYSTKMIFAVLDVSLIMGLNIGETDKVFYINFIKKQNF